MAAGRRGSHRSGALKAGKKVTELGRAIGADGNNIARKVDSPRSVPSEEDILAAVASLYDDELRPYGRILRKRLAERAGVNDGAARGGNDALRAACVAIAALRVESSSGGEWFVLLADRPPRFVDIYECQDLYTESFWETFALYLTTPSACGGGAEIQLPGGRYVCAQALMDLGLPFLAGYSFGRVCHIVQLAISDRKLLGYHDGGVVPYARSAVMLKQLCAEREEPCGRSDVLPHADWQTARACVHGILHAALAKGDAQVPLSNIKRLFHSVYHMELSETALGHTRLSELLKEPRFSDICTVELQGRGYAVLPAFQLGSTFQSIDQSVTCCDETPVSVSSRPSWASLLSEDLDVRGMVRCTFINAAPPPPTPLRTAACRARSVPKEVGLCQSARRPDDAEPCTPSKAAQTASMAKFCPDEPLCLEDAGEVQDFFNVVTPSPYPTLLEMSAQLRRVPAVSAVPCFSSSQYQPLFHDQIGSQAPLSCAPPAHEPGMLAQPEEPPCALDGFSLSSVTSATLPPSVSIGASCRRALQERGSLLLQELAPRELNSQAFPWQKELFSFQGAGLAHSAFPLIALTPLLPDATPRAGFCPDEPLCLEEAGSLIANLSDIPLTTPTPVMTSAFSKHAASCM